LLETSEDQHLSDWLVVDGGIVQHQHATYAVVNALEEPEEQVVDYPSSHRDSTVWLLDKDACNPDDEAGNILNKDAAKLLPFYIELITQSKFGVLLVKVEEICSIQ
jgi:hypothetical protein